MSGRLGEQGGFTLTEMLIGILTAMIVISAAFYIIDMSLKLNSRITDQIDSNEGAATAMEHISQLLHSSCLYPESAPVLANSTATTLYFVSEDQADASQVTPVPEEHVISLNGTTLQDTEYAYQSGQGTTASPFVFSSTPLTNPPYKILTNVSQAKNGSDHSTVQPVFTYYAYNSGGELPLFTSVQDAVNPDLPYSTTSFYPPGLSTPLTSATAATVAEVAINFVAAPWSGQSGQSVADTAGDRTTNLTDAVVLRFTASSAAGSSAPCD